MRRREGLKMKKKGTHLRLNETPSKKEDGYGFIVFHW